MTILPPIHCSWYTLLQIIKKFAKLDLHIWLLSLANLPSSQKMTPVYVENYWKWKFCQLPYYSRHKSSWLKKIYWPFKQVHTYSNIALVYDWEKNWHHCTLCKSRTVVYVLLISIRSHIVSHPWIFNHLEWIIGCLLANFHLQ